MAAPLLLCMGFASCSQDDMQQTGGTPLPDGKYPLQVSATVGAPQSRSVGKDSWVGDGGELFAVRIGPDGPVAKYVITDVEGRTVPVSGRLYWNNTNKATVSAWFPYDAQTNVDIYDQSTGFAQFDYLAATAEGQSYTAPVALQFTHKMAKVRCILKPGKGVTETDLKTATVKFAGHTSATFTEGTLTGSGSGWITPASDGEALLVPQNMTGKPLIKVSISGSDFIYTPSSEDAGNLQAGLLYQYTITVKANGIEVTAVAGGKWIGDGSENVGITITYDGTETEVKTGDYYYSDGTWSDGGLRKLYSDGTMEWEETVPQPLSDKTCIGIVFYAGRHDTDLSDYSKPLTADGPTIPDGKVHGYVVALTDVHNDKNDQLCWENGPHWDGPQIIGTSTNRDDWQGYSNCLKIHEFVEDATNKAAGWEMKHFPAALACETYGKRTLDQDGNDANGKYDWQKPLAAPQNTSGWFLPSYGQLMYLYQNRSVLSARMDVVKNSAPANYRDNIRWFNTLPYWSSTEAYDPDFPNWVYDVFFGDGSYCANDKTAPDGVRPILAF